MTENSNGPLSSVVALLARQLELHRSGRWEYCPVVLTSMPALDDVA